MPLHGLDPHSFETTRSGLSDDAIAVLCLVHDWWLVRGTWPKPSHIDRDPTGPIAPDRVSDAWVQARDLSLLDHEGGMGRLGLKLTALACFAFSDRRIRHVASLLDAIVRDLADIAPDAEPHKQYTPRQVMQALHISLADVRALAQIAGPSRLANQPWFDPWHPELNKRYVDEELTDTPMFSTPIDYPKIMAAGSGRAFLERYYGVGALPYRWNSAPVSPIGVVLDVDETRREVWLDGVPVHLRGLYFDNFALLLRARGDVVKYADERLRVRGDRDEANIQEQFREIRKAIDAAGEAASLHGLSAKDLVANAHGRGYRWQADSSAWRVEPRFV